MTISCRVRVENMPVKILHEFCLTFFRKSLTNTAAQQIKPGVTSFIPHLLAATVLLGLFSQAVDLRVVGPSVSGYAPDKSNQQITCTKN